MEGLDLSRIASRTAFSRAVTFLACWSLLTACSQQAETSSPEPRPVRTVTVATREASVPITLTGRIDAEDEVTLSFRIAGRILENDLKVGNAVKPGQLIARLESQNEMNALRA